MQGFGTAGGEPHSDNPVGRTYQNSGQALDASRQMRWQGRIGLLGLVWLEAVAQPSFGPLETVTEVGCAIRSKEVCPGTPNTRNGVVNL